MDQKAFQDYYPDDFNHCYGCGGLNEHGHQIKSYWDGDEAVAEFTPKPWHTALPGYVYGGLIASLIDCHSTGTAAAALYRHAGRPMDSEPPFRCVTASLHVDYLRPTPIYGPLKLRATVEKIEGNRVTVKVNLYGGGELCAKGEVLAVAVNEKWVNKWIRQE
ncbi:MAG: PaaI family thioesterase [Bacteroidales bacterium]|nr:PaaI family thioesterase [Bacteroidales bacterium]